MTAASTTPVRPRPGNAPATSWPITAIALDGRIECSSSAPLPGFSERRRYPYGRCYDSSDGGALFLFEFGAVVCEGVVRIPDSLRLLVEASVSRRLLPQTEETYLIVVDPDHAGDSPRVGWDRVTIPENRPELVAAVALLLAQSSALERYEVSVDALLDQALALSRDIAQRSRLPLGTRDLIRRVGLLTQDRLELASCFFLVDRPEETWEDSRVAHLYDALFANLELRQRHDAILHKLGAAERAAQTTLELWHGRRSNALEWAIVVLIVVEIALAFGGIR